MTDEEAGVARGTGRSGDRGCDRRGFLKLGSLTLFVSAVDGALAPAFADLGLPRARRKASGKTLVHVFQRFGADGLNTVIPIEAGEHATYRGFRPTLAVDAADPDLRPISSDFALHPVLRDGLAALWSRGIVAVLPNVGYPEGSRSHFDSQLYLDNGTPHDRTTADGWLNRYLQTSPASGDPLRAIALAVSLPVSLRGPSPVLVFSDVNALSVSPDAARNARFLALHEQTYAQPPGPRRHDAGIAATGRSILAGMRAIPPQLPAPTVAYPNGNLGRMMMQLAQLIRSDLFDIEVAAIEFPGWDTHAKQQAGSRGGTFPGLLREMSDAITAFVDDLGPQRMADVVVATSSEFGRTARENGSFGTDHGSAWASFVIGGAVRGGIYFGPAGWHGLTDLREGRDLKHSLDFRDMFSEILARHLGGLSPAVFPDWTPSRVGLL